MTTQITFEPKGEIKASAANYGSSVGLAMVDHQGNSLVVIQPSHMLEDMRLVADLLSGKVRARDLRQPQEESEAL